MEYGRIQNYIFRSIAASDEDKVRQIIFDILGKYGLTLDIEGVDHDLFNIVEHYNTGLFGVIVHSKDQDIVGSYALFPISSTEVELRKMYLLEEHRGKGLGKWIIDFCLDYAKRNRYSVMTLESASVLKEALQLYLSKGFKRVSVPNHTQRCDVVMEYNLSEYIRKDGEI